MCKKSPEQCKAKVKCKCCKEKLDKEQEDGKLNLNEVDNNFELQYYIIDLKGDTTMSLTKDKIKDRIFELELEQKEIQMYLTQAAVWGNGEEFLSTQKHYNKLSQENQCWIAYYKDRLKDIEDEEKYDE